MAVTWGSWDYGGGNGMRIGIEVTWGAVSHSSTSVTATVDYWTDNQYTYADNQYINFFNDINPADYNYYNGQGSTATKRVTKTYTHTYSTYGSSPGDLKVSGTVHGTYNGVTPTVTVTSAIPARPAVAPSTPSVTATAGIREISISFSSSDDGGSGISSYNYSLDNSNWSGAITSPHTITGLANGTAYTVYVRANNGVGSSGSGSDSATTASLPTAPSSLTANASTFGQVGLSWTAGNGNGYTITYTVKRGGTTLGTTTSTSYTDSTVAPATAYTYTVTSGTSVGSNGTASVSTTSLGGVVNIWNGSSYAKVLPKVWNGTAWVDSQARVWNGTEWKYGI